MTDLFAYDNQAVLNNEKIALSVFDTESVQLCILRVSSGKNYTGE
jgi:hypothetical protein